VCMLNSVVCCFISNSACYFKSVICYWCPWLYVAWSVTPNYVCRYEIMLLYFKSDQSMLDQSVGSMFWTKLPITDRFQYISVRFCSFPNNRICPVHFRFRHFNFRFHLIKKYESENGIGVFSIIHFQRLFRQECYYHIQCHGLWPTPVSGTTWPVMLKALILLQSHLCYMVGMWWLLEALILSNFHHSDNNIIPKPQICIASNNVKLHQEVMS
jgi:hypothetical protein